MWRGDFETGSLEQFSYVLNPTGVSLVADPTAQGRYAAKLSVDADQLWPNGLNRVELQHQPQTSAEGQSTWFGFSFYLPTTLAASDHLIAYWETQQTYQQLMRLVVNGTRLSFTTTQPEDVEQAAIDEVVTAAAWHRVVMHVDWHSDPQRGRVSVWFDGRPMVIDLPARTFVDHPAFVQFGLLRQPTLDHEEIMIVDCALEGQRREDVSVCR